MSLPGSCHIPFFYKKPSSEIDASYSLGVCFRCAKTEENYDYQKSPFKHLLKSTTAQRKATYWNVGAVCHSCYIKKVKSSTET